MLSTEHEQIIKTLRIRFEKHKARHQSIEWSDVEIRLRAQVHKLDILCRMENTGGEPDVVGKDNNTGAYIFFDCSPESPSGRRSFCYDPEALASRKENKPLDSAIGAAAEIGIALLTEQQYRQLQELGKFDLKTSSWVKTPEKIRSLGGALFCDRRYDTVFLYHNGAESYYAARGFRGCITV